MDMNFWTTLLTSLTSGVVGGILGTLCLELLRHRLATSREVTKEGRDNARRGELELTTLEAAMQEVWRRIDSFTLADADRIAVVLQPQPLVNHLVALRSRAKDFIALRTTVEIARKETPSPDQTALEQRKSASEAAIAGRTNHRGPAVKQQHEALRAKLARLEQNLTDAGAELTRWLSLTTDVVRDLRSGVLKAAEIEKRIVANIANYRR